MLWSESNYWALLSANLCSCLWWQPIKNEKFGFHFIIFQLLVLWVSVLGERNLCWGKDLSPRPPLFWVPFEGLCFWIFGGGPLSAVLSRNSILQQRTLAQSVFHWSWHTLWKALFSVSQHFPNKIHFVWKLPTSLHPVLAAHNPL